MDDPNITMEEYIRLEEEKARKRRKVFNWETATYGKVYCEDLDSFTDFETNFPSIVYNDALTSNQNVSSKPTVIRYVLGIVGINHCTADNLPPRPISGNVSELQEVSDRLKYEFKVIVT
ncbi:hypothetical protein Tco_0281145 [Tanacetum coccineum]